MVPLDFYLALPPAERRVFDLWLVVHHPLTIDDLQRWVALAALPPADHAPKTQRDFKALFERWKANGLLTKLASRYASSEYILSHVVRHAVAAQLAPAELARLAAIVRRESPLTSYYVQSANERLARELFLLMYLEPAPQLAAALARFEAMLPADDLPRILFDALGMCPPREGLDKLGSARADRYVRTAVSLAVEHLLALGPGPLQYVLDARARLDSAVLLDALYYLTLRGDLELVGQVAGDDTHVDVLSARSFLALAEGDFRTARQHAQHALEATRTKKTRQLKGVSNRLWPWLVLALLTSTEAPEHAALAREVMRLPPKKLSPWWNLPPLLALRGFLDGEPSSTREDRGWLQPHGWEERTLWGLSVRFRGEIASSERTKSLAHYGERAAQSGLAWLAAELPRIALAAQGQASEVSGLAALYLAEQPWERALRALESALSTADDAVVSPTTQNEERLVWSLVVQSERSHRLSARVQTRTKSGFSAGRQVSWKKLHDAGLDAPYASEHDRRVIALIKLVRDFYHPGAGNYEPLPSAALALVGHPLVFSDLECSTHVEVVRRDVRIDVRDHEGEVLVTVLPGACVLDEAVCEREGVERILVYALTPQQRIIAQQLTAGGLRLPAAARPRAQQVLGQLASHFPVSSELPLETPNVSEVPADPRVYIQLRRASPGLRVRWCVVPLGSGPQFPPGVGSANVLGTRTLEAGTSLRSRAGEDPAASTNVRCTRDLAGETRELARVLSACPTLADVDADARELSLSDLTACLELLCELRALGDSIVVAWPDGQALAVVAERKVSDLKLALREQGSWFHAEGELAVDATRKLSFRELLDLVAVQSGRFVPLGDGQFLALSESLRRTLDSAVALSRTKGAEVSLHPLAVLGLSELSEAQLKTDKLVSERLLRAREAPALSPELPHTFEATLRPYQREGYVFLSRLAHWGAGAVLADDMGLGKTLQTLALMVEHASRGPALVVAPTSVCTNWLDEARKFAPSLRVVRFGGGPREQVLRELGPLDVLVCSYGLLQQEGALLASKRFQVIVLDEAQAIKNAGTLRAKAALGLVGNVRIALTGTPIENHLGELWSILSFANPGLLGTPKNFEDRFVKPIQRDGDRAKSLLLRRLIKPFVLRRKKSEVLDDLPDKTIITLRVEPSEDERAFFAALREQALARVSDRDKPAEARIRLLAELMRLRRAACHPALVAPDSALASSKLATLEALLEELIQGGHRVLVFSQFVDYLSLVRERLVALGISHQYLDGSSSTRARADAVATFQAGSSDVFLISLKAGGFGLNLTAADYVVHLDPWWNPAVEDQASDRAHRIGQTRPVTIYRLVMEGSIEEKILALHANKRQLADDLLEGTSAGPTLSVDELIELLSAPHDAPSETPPRVTAAQQPRVSTPGE
ncbi:MAG: hypothetical protein RLZZ450_919 [Pseudomonadota bacterium]|jgi:superfamily II DNA or RNA helicase/tetratricopeptide (TPR) repeat protein